MERSRGDVKMFSTNFPSLPVIHTSRDDHVFSRDAGSLQRSWIEGETMRHFAPRWILKRGEQQKVDSDDAAIPSEWIHNEIRIVYGFYCSSGPVA